MATDCNNAARSQDRLLRFIRMPEVLHQTGIGSKTDLYRRVSAGTFPSSIRVSHRVAVWREDAVQDWMRKQMPPE